MMEQLDYAEMLEIPVNTVNVTKKRSIFKRKQKNQPQEDNIKERVVESVNERVGAYVISEDVSDPPKPEKLKTVGKRDKKSIILWTEAALVGIIALAIFVTNLLVPSTVINTFISSFSKTTEEELVYSQFKLSSVVNDFSEAEVTLSEDGVLCYTAEGSVYPVCDGTVASVTETDGVYTMEIKHTSTFTSKITGLNNAYSAVGTKVESNIPVGYSDGNAEVRVTLYDNGNVLTCIKLDNETPVWTV